MTYQVSTGDKTFLKQLLDDGDITNLCGKYWNIAIEENEKNLIKKNRKIKDRTSSINKVVLFPVYKNLLQKLIVTLQIEHYEIIEKRGTFFDFLNDVLSLVAQKSEELEFDNKKIFNIMRQMFLNIVYFDSAEYCLKFKDLSALTPLNFNQYYKKDRESFKEQEEKNEKKRLKLKERTTKTSEEKKESFILKEARPKTALVKFQNKKITETIYKQTPSEKIIRSNSFFSHNSQSKNTISLEKSNIYPKKINFHLKRNIASAKMQMRMDNYRNEVRNIESKRTMLRNSFSLFYPPSAKLGIRTQTFLNAYSLNYDETPFQSEKIMGGDHRLEQLISKLNNKKINY